MCFNGFRRTTSHPKMRSLCCTNSTCEGNTCVDRRKPRGEPIDGSHLEASDLLATWMKVYSDRSNHLIISIALDQFLRNWAQCAGSAILCKTHFKEETRIMKINKTLPIRNSLGSFWHIVSDIWSERKHSPWLQILGSPPGGKLFRLHVDYKG